MCLPIRNYSEWLTAGLDRSGSIHTKLVGSDLGLCTAAIRNNVLKIGAGLYRYYGNMFNVNSELKVPQV